MKGLIAVGIGVVIGFVLWGRKAGQGAASGVLAAPLEGAGDVASRALAAGQEAYESVRDDAAKVAASIGAAAAGIKVAPAGAACAA